MKTVIIVISTYNGARQIERQLDSIFAQIGVDVRVLVRDDCSKDNTVEVVQKYVQRHPNNRIEIIKGENVGYAKSFWLGLSMCNDADYYAFADQVEILKPEQLTKKLTLIKTYNYGAATVINKSAKELVCRVWPEVDDLPHDMWIGTLCFWFGKVYYVDEELYYWIRYDTSVTGEGTKETAIQYRLKKTLQKKSYPNISTAMLEFYSDILKPSDQAFLNKVSDYKNVFKDKMSLLFDPSFKRLTVAGTVALKLGILLNWY